MAPFSVILSRIFSLLLLLVLVTGSRAEESTEFADVASTYNGIEVINTGTGRTGSTTLQAALNILGYKAYHLREIFFGRGDDLDFWMDAYTTNCSKPEQLRALFASGNFTASAHSIHWPCLEKMIFDIYPNAKVIHTQRSSAELWHDSASNSICKLNGPGLRKYFMKFMQFVKPVFRRFQEEFVPLLMGRVVFGSYEPVYGVSRELCLENKDRMISHYLAHNRRIQEMVPPERLLVLENHKDGWTKLCKFLGKPVPDVPFPHENKRENMMTVMVIKMWDEHVGLTGTFILFMIGGLILGLTTRKVVTGIWSKYKESKNKQKKE